MHPFIYLDHAAATPIHPEAASAMLTAASEHFGNASSTHWAGRKAKSTVAAAREAAASFLGCSPGEIVFTGSGTESDNLALIGAATANRDRGSHIITTQIEHHAVLHTCEFLEKNGFEITYVPVDSHGQVSLSDIEAAIRPSTILISVMYGNNETGTLQPIEAIGELARSRGILFHVDAVQALGHATWQLSRMPVDLLSISAHKLNGPKGVGALYIAKQARVEPLIHGGAQERKRRAGTENVAGIAGFAAALQFFTQSRYEHVQHMETLRNTMIEQLTNRLGENRFIINGHPTDRLPHILNISFPGISSETMLMNLDLAGVAASSGSACTSGSLQRSHVLKAMRLPEEVAASAVRFSFGRGNDCEQIVKTAEIIETIFTRLRSKG